MGKKKESNNWIYIKFLEDWVNHTAIRYLMYIVLGFFMYLLLMGQVIPETYELKLGQKSPITLKSPITVVNEWETNILKEKAAEKVQPVYTKDDTITSNQIDKLESFFNAVLDSLNKDGLSKEEKINQIQDTQDIFPKDSTIINQLVDLPIDKVKNIKYISKTTIDVVMNNGIKMDNLDDSYSKAQDLIKTNPYDSDDKIKNISYEIAKVFVVPNESINHDQTLMLKQDERNKVQPAMIKKDDVIVEKNQTINNEIYEKLKASGLLKDTSSIWPYFGLLLLVLLLLLLLFYSIERMKPMLHRNNKALLMVFVIISLTIIGISVLRLIDDNSITSPIGYLAPVAFGVMLITLLSSLRFAILSGAIFSIFASLVFNTDQSMLFDFRYGFVLLMGSTAGAFVIGRVKQRSSILKAGLVIALFNVLSILVLIMLNSQAYTYTEGLKSVFYGIIGGIFSAILTIGFLPFFESAFGILSPINLIELSNPNHPLLRKLLIETPGTYHHSIIVGNLAESAAEAIGADGLLARVGAYYHDLGKTKRPTFFIENQLNMENPHDKISPSLSKKIILSHTKDGVELLKEYKIPVPIRDIALQHHGTTLLKYFYNKALKDSEEPIPESDYRYQGPKPKSKEAAIVGIADSVEAAVRSMQHPSNEAIEETVRKIIKSKLDDNQLNECDLTLKELEIIAISMLETLKGIFHSRIEYPDDKEIEENKGAKSS